MTSEPASVQGLGSHLGLIVKVAERCNLACPYCYMYEFEESWRDRPRFLSEQLTEKLVDRVAEHLALDPARGVVLELHGGEPLLWGRGRFRRLVDLTSPLRGDGRLEIVVQTNGVLFDAEWLSFFVDAGIPWSISCDGPPRLHDKNRKTHAGHGTSTVVENAIRLSVTSVHTPFFGGVLGVADCSIDPGEVLRYFHDLGVRAVDLLLPDRTRVQPAERAWGRWLTRLFDAWIELDDPGFTVRTIHDFALGVLGVKSGLDALGGEISGLLTVESDGSLQLLDVLRICGSSVPIMGAHLNTHSLEESVGKAARILPQAPTECRSCRAFSSCGGGYLPHRWDGTHFDNPSTYCSALLGLHDHMGRTFMAVTPVSAWRDLNETTEQGCYQQGLPS